MSCYISFLQTFDTLRFFGIRFSRYKYDRKRSLGKTLRVFRLREHFVFSVYNCKQLLGRILRILHLERMLRILNGDGGIRTLDPLLARQVLSQLSYTPILIWQPPTLPCRLQHSIIGRKGLNHRVRDENGCVP